MLIDTGKKFEGKVEHLKSFSCQCGKGAVAIHIHYSDLGRGYTIQCDSCGRGYLVALASSKLYLRTEVKSSAISEVA